MGDVAGGGTDPTRAAGSPVPPGGGGAPLGRFAVAAGLMPLEAVVAVAVEAEAHGAEAVFCGEGPVEVDAMVAAAAVLYATTTVRAGPGLATVQDRHPVALARAAASLDRLAPGRALLGLGRGDRTTITEAYGLTMSGLEALEDSLRIVRALLGGERADHAGRRWSAHAGPLPERSRPTAPVPVLLGAVGERALRLAGRLADGVLLNYGAGPDHVAWAVDRVAAGAREAGRDPDDVDVFGWVLAVRTDLADAESRLDAARRTLAFLAAQAEAAVLLGSDAGRSRFDDGAVARHAAVGDREAILRRLGEYREAGLRCPVLLPSGVRAVTGDVVEDAARP